MNQYYQNQIMYWQWDGQQWLPAYYPIKQGLPTAWHMFFLILGLFTFGAAWVIWVIAAGIAEYNSIQDEKRAKKEILAYYERVQKGGP